VVFDWQALAILHAAEPGMLERIYHDGATGPECLWISRALGTDGATGRQQCHGQDDRRQTLHFESPTPPAL
jgi:hypothetical protein